METFVLIPGAGGVAWIWHRVVPLLQEAGHRAVAVDLPGDDPEAGLEEYAQLVLAAVDHDEDVVLVAQSLGAFTALHAASRLPLRRLVMLNAMIPVPGETAHDWWGNTGSEAAQIAAARERGYTEAIDLATYFLHDVPPEVLVGSDDMRRNESDAAFQQPCGFERWPDVPTQALAGSDDRFFPASFQDRVARERIGIGADVVPGGHLNVLSRPNELVTALLR